MQPSVAISRARARYCCWLPPHPCTKSTPGTAVAGAISVPAIRSPSTAICRRWSRVDIRLDRRVLGDEADERVDAAEIHRCIPGDLRLLPINLTALRTYRAHQGIGAEGFERRDFRATRAARPPRLLEHAAHGGARCVTSARNVIVAARREEAGEALSRRPIVGTRLFDREAHVGTDV